ncbi:MAG: hypothetical protein FWH14_03585 [Oscillospiraceae bacterium]|nr:hypothetical protein [Oscillospiraceae bacterium]
MPAAITTDDRGHPYRPHRRNNHGRQIAAPTGKTPAAAAAPSLRKRAGA